MVRLGEAISRLGAVAAYEPSSELESSDIPTPPSIPPRKGEGRASHILKAIPSRVRLAALIQRISAG